MGHQSCGSQVFLVSLFDARGTHNNNYDIFTKLPEFKLYLQYHRIRYFRAWKIARRGFCDLQKLRSATLMNLNSDEKFVLRKLQFMFYVMIEVRRFNHELPTFVHYFKSRFIIKVVITKRAFASPTKHLMSHRSVRRRRHGGAYITQGLRFTSASKFRSTLFEWFQNSQDCFFLFHFD